jgi:hypothetical protein
VKSRDFSPDPRTGVKISAFPARVEDRKLTLSSVRLQFDEERPRNDALLRSRQGSELRVSNAAAQTRIVSGGPFDLLQRAHDAPLRNALGNARRRGKQMVLMRLRAGDAM